MKKIFTIVAIIVFTSNAYSSTFHIDPVNGNNLGDGSLSSPWKTLEEVINANLIESKSYITPYDPSDQQLVIKNATAPIKANDTLILYSGLHGDVFIQNYINDQNITVLNAPGNTPIFRKLHIQAGKNWIFKGIEISSEPYGTYLNDKLVFLESHDWQGPVSNITVENCSIYSTSIPWTAASDWVNKASDGIFINAGTNLITIESNTVENIRFGIRMRGDYLTVSGNTIKNFSGDGIRLVSSNNIVEKNIVKNCYKVDDNHDDGIQSFTTGGLTVDNNIIRQNIILNYEDPNQPLLGDLQGIGCFDGPFNDWTIENNLIAVNHWHGIALYGATNISIINNTVLDPTPSTGSGPSWIKIEDDTGLPSSNCIVKNNVVNTISVTSNTATGNNTLLQTLTDYSSNFVDYSNYDFHLRQTSTLIDAADNTVAPAIDLEGNARPSGTLPDIGSYEYIYPSAIENFTDTQFRIFPNPFSDYIEIQGIDAKARVNIFDISGNLVKEFNYVNLPAKLKVNNLNDGVYFISISKGISNYLKTKVLIKER